MQKKGAAFFVFVGVVKNSVRLALRNSLRAKRASGLEAEYEDRPSVLPPYVLHETLLSGSSDVAVTFIGLG